MCAPPHHQPGFLKQKFDQETGPKHDKTGGVFAGFRKPDMLAADGRTERIPTILSADGRYCHGGSVGGPAHRPWHRPLSQAPSHILRPRSPVQLGPMFNSLLGSTRASNTTNVVVSSVVEYSVGIANGLLNSLPSQDKLKRMQVAIMPNAA